MPTARCARWLRLFARCAAATAVVMGWPLCTVHGADDQQGGVISKLKQDLIKLEEYYKEAYFEATDTVTNHGRNITSKEEVQTAFDGKRQQLSLTYLTDGNANKGLTQVFVVDPGRVSFRLKRAAGATDYTVDWMGASVANNDTALRDAMHMHSRYLLSPFCVTDIKLADLVNHPGCKIGRIERKPRDAGAINGDLRAEFEVTPTDKPDDPLKLWKTKVSGWFEVDTARSSALTGFELRYVDSNKQNIRQHGVIKYRGTDGEIPLLESTTIELYDGQKLAVTKVTEVARFQHGKPDASLFDPTHYGIGGKRAGYTPRRTVTVVVLLVVLGGIALAAGYFFRRKKAAKRVS